MPLPPLVQSIVDWLRRGYPDGVPRQDYLPLLALLGRHLSADEAADVVAALLDGQQVAEVDTSRGAVRRAIEATTDSPALRSDVARVNAHLEAIRHAEAGLRDR